MTKLTDIAAERKFLDDIVVELFNAKTRNDYDSIKEAVEDLELVVQHTEVALFRKRAQRLIDKAFDPLR